MRGRREGERRRRKKKAATCAQLAQNDWARAALGHDSQLSVES